MKSICIKTNNQEIIDYIITTLEKLPMNVCISNYRFKMFDNVIVHDLTKNEDDFYEIMAIIIKSVIEKFYEKSIIRKCIRRNYFYLNDEEQDYVFKISNQIMNLPDEKIGHKNQVLKELVKKYIIENKAIILDGFVNFRLKNYKELLENIVEVSVVSFLELTSF